MSDTNNNISEENALASISSQQEVSNEVNERQEKEIDWHKLAHKLREHNRKLLKKVFQLEQEIIESNQALVEQQKIAKSNDLYTASQAEKINNYQEQIDDLLERVANYEQQEEHQKSTVAILSHQLKISEEKVDKLEKDCTQIKALNKTQEIEIIANKQQIQELNTRYYRQQQNLLTQKTSQYQANTDRPIKAWSANPLEIDESSAAPLVSGVNRSHNRDWPAPAIAKTQEKLKTIAAVKLPQFPRKVEGE